jgi:hypothetical protein
VPSYTLAELRTQQLSSDISARLSAALLAAGLPVADWAPAASGGVELSVVEMVAGGLANLVGPRLVAMAEARFLDLGRGDALSAYAQSRYQISRSPATYTLQNIRLTSTVSASFNAGDLWIAGAGGNRYVSIEDVILVPGVPADVTFQAEEPGSAYADTEGQISRMVTAPAGLSGLNARPSDFTPTSLLGTSSGTINAPPLPGYWRPGKGPPPYGSIRIRILTTGEAGAIDYEYSLDGGLTWAPGYRSPIAAPIPASWSGYTSIIFFKNAAPPSFIAGDIFTMLVGDPILQRGADEETDSALRARCKDQWSSLSDVPTEGLVRLWCHQASPEVVQVKVDADPNTPGAILVRIASATGPASPRAQIAVQDYVSARLKGYRGVPRPATLGSGSPAEAVLCSSARPRYIAEAGVASVPRTKLAAVQQEADRLWQLYLGTVGIGGVVRLAELEQAILDAGATDVKGVLLGPPLAAANIPLAPDEIAVPAAGSTLTSSMSWQPL